MIINNRVSSGSGSTARPEAVVRFMGILCSLRPGRPLATLWPPSAPDVCVLNSKINYCYSGH